LKTTEKNVIEGIEGKGSGVSTLNKPQQEKGISKGGSMSSKTNKMSPATKGTSLGSGDGRDENVSDNGNDGSFELVGEEPVEEVGSSRPGSKMPALRSIAVMRDDRDERCPGRPRAKGKPVTPVTLKASKARRSPP